MKECKSLFFKKNMFCLLIFVFVIIYAVGVKLFYGLKEISENTKMTAISEAACAYIFLEKKYYCGVKYLVDGVEISVLGEDKQKKLNDKDIEKIIEHLKLIKPIISKERLKVNFDYRLVIKDENLIISEHSVNVKKFEYITYKSVVM